jgi:hypothetical protein
LKALLDQPDYTFTDLSPSGNAVRVNEGLKFSFLDTRTTLLVNLPWPAWSGTRVSTDPAVIDSVLTGRDREVYRDHVRAGAAHHVVMRRGSDCCYVMFRHERRKGLPVFVSLLHVSDPRLFRAMIRTFSSHVLLRHRALATLIDHHVVPLPLWPTVPVRRGRPKMFRSTRLQAADIDYLYSELACVPW